MNRGRRNVQRVLRSVSVCASLWLLSTFIVFGQGVTGSFTGAVKDTSGANVPAAAVKVRSVDSGREWQNVTNDSGIYYIAGLPPGAYSLAVEAPGFKRLLTNSITLEVNQSARSTSPWKSAPRRDD